MWLMLLLLENIIPCPLGRRHGVTVSNGLAMRRLGGDHAERGRLGFRFHGFSAFFPRFHEFVFRVVVFDRDEPL